MTISSFLRPRKQFLIKSSRGYPCLICAVKMLICVMVLLSFFSNSYVVQEILQSKLVSPCLFSCWSEYLLEKFKRFDCFPIAALLSSGPLGGWTFTAVLLSLVLPFVSLGKKIDFCPE